MSFMFVFLVFITTNAIKLKINENMMDGNGFYGIYINDELWLDSGEINGYFNNKWYTTNKSKASTSNDYNLINLINKETKYDLYDDYNGKHYGIIYNWITDDYMTKFSTIFNIYDDNKTINFRQYYPDKVSGTDYIPTNGVPNGCQGSFDPVPILSFPSFNVNTDNLYGNNNLGYLTWGDTFSTAKIGKAPLPTTALNGINGASVVLFNQV